MQKNSKPKVSILMNCYNGERFLRQALESVLGQTYENWEIIFWDNQSQDSSSEIFKSYREERFKYFFAPSHTLLYEARNHAIEKAEGDYIAFLDVDDLWEPQKLEMQMKLFSNGFDVVYSNYWVKTGEKRKKISSRKLPSGKILEIIIDDYKIGLLTIIIKKISFHGIYKFNKNYKIIGDYDLMVEMSKHNSFGCVDMPLATYRVHGENESITQFQRYIEELEAWVDCKKCDYDLQKTKKLPYVTSKIEYLKIRQMIEKKNFKGALTNVFKLKKFNQVVKVLYFSMKKLM